MQKSRFGIFFTIFPFDWWICIDWMDFGETKEPDSDQWFQLLHGIAHDEEKTWATLEIRSHRFRTYFLPCRSFHLNLSNVGIARETDVTHSDGESRRFRFEGNPPLARTPLHSHTNQHRLELVTRNEMIIFVARMRRIAQNVCRKTCSTMAKIKWNAQRHWQDAKVETERGRTTCVVGSFAI